MSGFIVWGGEEKVGFACRGYMDNRLPQLHDVGTPPENLRCMLRIAAGAVVSGEKIDCPTAEAISRQV